MRLPDEEASRMPGLDAIERTGVVDHRSLAWREQRRVARGETGKTEANLSINESELVGRHPSHEESEPDGTTQIQLL